MMRVTLSMPHVPTEVAVDGAGMPCECNPCDGIDEPPKLSPVYEYTPWSDRPFRALSGPHPASAIKLLPMRAASLRLPAA
jgi:hypothetical protein